MLHFIAIDPECTSDQLGYVPGFLSSTDARSAKEQLDANYRHGGGWRPLSGFSFDKNTWVIQYPGDPPLKPLAAAHLRAETVIIYRHAWVLILQDDGAWEVARLD